MSELREAADMAINKNCTEHTDGRVTVEAYSVKRLRAALASDGWVAWLIELNISDEVGGANWLCLSRNGLGWTDDPNEAIRFSSRKHAADVKCGYFKNQIHQDAKIVEHKWVNP